MDSPEQDVTRLIHAMFDAFQAGDPQAIEHCLADDATVWDAFTPQLIRGRDERARFHQQDQAQKQVRGPLTLTVETPVIDSWESTAIARYYLGFRYEPPNAASGRVRITDVLRRTADGWQIVHHHEGLAPAESSVAADRLPHS